MSFNPEDSIKIENVVASVKLNDELDLISLSSLIPGAEYDKKKFPGIVLRLGNPKIAALIFGSGKVVLTGAKSIEILNRGLDYLIDLFKSLNVDIVENPSYSIQNIVTSADLGSRINLNKIAMSAGLDQVEYEPEQFPGLVYRLDEPKVVVLMFGSGKLIITGAKNPDTDAKDAVRNIREKLEMFNLL